ncbi:MAG TPA: glycosyltransferase family 39 protein [Candidatus Binataceae bacterium]|nr:glycosyltransferase family 39 protein [Candidatus Binataceae bacterium]
MESFGVTRCPSRYGQGAGMVKREAYNPSLMREKPSRVEMAAPNRQLKIFHIVGLALLLRVLLPSAAYFYTRDSTIFYTADSASYIAPAGELVAHHRFFSDGSEAARVWNSPIRPAPEIVRTPGYPILLAAGLLSGHMTLVTIALQILFNCLTVYLVYRTTGLLFEGEKIALIAATLYAFDPLAILFCSLLSTETLFTALVMTGTYYLVRYLRRQSLTDLIISATALAIAIYVRPAGYFLPVMIAAALAAWALVMRKENKWQLLRHLSLYLLVWVAIIAPWRLRNQIATGYSGFTSVFSEDLYCNLAASVMASQQDLSYSDMQNRMGCFDLALYLREHPEQRAWTEQQVLSYKRVQAIHILISNPISFARIYFAGVIRGIFDPTSTELIRFFDFYPKDGGLLDKALDRGVIAAVEALLLDPLLAWSTFVLLALHLAYLSSAGLGVIRASKRDPAVLMMLLIMTYYLVVPGGPAVWARFRHPAMPIICMFAAYALSNCSFLRTASERALFQAERSSALA